MSRRVSIGYQEFADIISNDLFYVDKTLFIKEWWERRDYVTLITRPRRFGKTLTMSMIENFFSITHKKNVGLFHHLNIWKEESYQKLQGTYPVISITFANVKERTFQMAKQRINQILTDLYNKHIFLLDGDLLTEEEKIFFKSVTMNMDETIATLAIHKMSDFLSRYYEKKVIILLDEYDTPMQEAYVNGYWDELSSFLRSLLNAAFKTNPYLERAIMTGITRVSKESIFSDLNNLEVPMQEAYVNGYWDELSSFLRSLLNAAFKTNPYLERAIMTGITRVSKESIFSDLNNLEVVTTTSEKYADAFGFTEEEVFTALEEYNLSDKSSEVKRWYDGFTFGHKKDIYNPWSIIHYLDKQKVGTYWANTSSNSLIGKIIREGSCQVKESFEELLAGRNIITQIDEQIVYNRLDLDENAIWSLFLASGYLKIVNEVKGDATSNEWEELYELSITNFEDATSNEWEELYELSITNFEVMVMFRNIVRNWFALTASNYNAFLRAFLQDDLRAMNAYMNRTALATFSFFDGGNRPSEGEPERFYHGFVLGLMVELENRYMITSNRESGFGRYDVMLEPRNKTDDAMILEFKVQDSDEKSLEDTVKAALKQIDEKQYAVSLIEKGVLESHIRKYGFAFCGKQVLIGK